MAPEACFEGPVSLHVMPQSWEKTSPFFFFSQRACIFIIILFSDFGGESILWPHLLKHHLGDGECWSRLGTWGRDRTPPVQEDIPRPTEISPREPSLKFSQMSAVLGQAGPDPAPKQLSGFQFSVVCSPLTYRGGTQKIGHLKKNTKQNQKLRFSPRKHKCSRRVCDKAA